MASLQNYPSVHRSFPPSSLPQLASQRHGTLPCCRRSAAAPCVVRAEQVASSPSTSPSLGRRQLLALGVAVPGIVAVNQNSVSFAAESKKGFLPVTDKKDGYSFLYPFGWQEVVIEGQDKVFKDVIEPLESVSVNLIPTNKEDIRDLGPPEQVLAPPSQKTKLIAAKEHDVDGKAYYTFEFVAKAPNYTRHALSTISIGNGKFYTLTTGANERRWGKMKDKLETVVDSFKIFTVYDGAA
ncbi:hypothetical protein EUGRSUZ_G02904 [Eucalyptus grandis]|uniref:Uncharacterized protein n=2 Tax=Eucalyptus grandis TaxID=71139 RepID=A0ACC3K7J1_EUCGR|nr:hypothetical protein EUGRSUZ_G02904 [Eucalyptus grandis]